MSKVGCGLVRADRSKQELAALNLVPLGDGGCRDPWRLDVVEAF
jgi:hypothetical protein